MHREAFSLSDEELEVLRTPTQDHGTKSVASERESETDAVHPTLQELHRRLTDHLSTALAGLVNRDVDVQLRDQAIGTYSQFVFGQPVPTCCAIVRAEPIELEFYIAMQPSILYPLMDRLLGCNQVDPIPQCPITEIESGLARIILSGVVAKYRAAWQQALSLEMRIERLEHNVQQLAALAGSEPTYRVRYGISSGSHFGQLEICLPWRGTRQMRQRLAAID